MIRNKPLDHIKNHKVNPRSEAWDKLKAKLDKHKAKRKIRWYRNLSFAASIFAVLSFIYIFSETLPVKKDKMFASNHLYKPAVLEDLPLVDADPFYDASKIIQISEGDYLFPLD